jgi:hypothetical protein
MKYFVGTFILAVLSLIFFILSRNYTEIVAKVMKAGVVFNPFVGTTTTTSTMTPRQTERIQFKYEISYEYNGKSHIATVDDYNKYNIGDNITITIDKKIPEKPTTPSAYPILFAICLTLFCFSLVVSVIVMYVIRTEWGSAMMCARGIVDSIKRF